MKPKLQYLTVGPAVAELQATLNRLMPLARPPLAVDGKFGDRTLARVKEFQRARGLAVDGVVGNRTWAALDGVAAPAQSAPHGSPMSPAVQSLLIRSGHMLRCTFGAANCHLRLDDSKRPATVKDCVPGTNIPSFGACRSPHHPAAFAMQNPFKPNTHDRPVGGFIQCTPMPAYGVWKTGGKVIDPATGCQLLLRGADCSCQFGGVMKAL